MLCLVHISIKLYNKIVRMSSCCSLKGVAAPSMYALNCTNLGLKGYIQWIRMIVLCSLSFTYEDLNTYIYESSIKNQK